MRKKEPTPKLVVDPALEVLKKNERERLEVIHKQALVRVDETILELDEILGDPDEYGLNHTVKQLERNIKRRNELACDIKILKGEHHA